MKSILIAALFAATFSGAAKANVDPHAGAVQELSAPTGHEVARYLPVTCFAPLVIDVGRWILDNYWYEEPGKKVEWQQGVSDAAACVERYRN